MDFCWVQKKNEQQHLITFNLITS